MEDNLSRARTSLAVASHSSGSNTSTPSPPIARATSALFMSTNSSSPSGPGHSRMNSDNSLRIGLPIKVYPQRSSSVLGVPNTRQQPLTGSKSADQLNGQYNKRTSYIVREALVSLDPLSEDAAAQVSNRGQLAMDYRHSTLSSPIFEPDPERGLSRSASVTHMRDIKDQVKDLKGKISSLREQARADSLRRVSLQSLRTPSPFTYAQVDQWYAGSGSGADGSKHETSAEEPARSGDETASPGKDSAVNIGPEIISDGEDNEASSVYRHEDVGDAVHIDHGDFDYGDFDHGDYESQEALREEGFVDVEDEDEDMFTENGDLGYEEGAAVSDGYDSMSESGESMYHEAVQTQLSHEDREDAFDYEHFFLHSAIGTIGQRRGSEASYSSETSVETTRGPLPEDDNKRPQTLARRGSETSILTIESFATADEGVSGRRSMESSRSKKSETAESPEDPQTATQARFAGAGPTPYGYTDRPSPEGQRRQETRCSVIHPPVSTTMTRPRRGPSVSSVDSTGTTRSFPLVNRTSKSSSTGTLTPDGGSPSQAVRSNPTSPLRNTTVAYGEVQTGVVANKAHEHSISLHSINSTASLIEGNGTTAVMETLPRDDQFLVERLVASLGRCVLGLTESNRASAEARVYRRRIDNARKILEGLEHT